MNWWATSDQHFAHANIIKYSNRQFCMNAYEKSIMDSGDKEAIKNLKISPETLIKHNELLIKYHNDRVKEDDVVYNLGDFYLQNSYYSENGVPCNWKDFRSRLNGIHIDCLGNHDYHAKMPTKTYEMSIYFGGIQMHLSHKPTDANPNFAINLTAHVHNCWAEKSFREYYNQCNNALKADPSNQEYSRFISRWKDTDKSKSILINVGVDVRKFMPMNLNEVLSIYHRWKKNAK